MSLKKSDFFAYKALPLEKVNVPILGGEVYVRTLNDKQRDQYELAQAKAGTGVDYRARMAVYLITDESGHPIFDESDIDTLSGLSSAILDPILEAGNRLNKFGPEEVADLAKN